MKTATPLNSFRFVLTACVGAVVLSGCAVMDDKNMIANLSQSTDLTNKAVPDLRLFPLQAHFQFETVDPIYKNLGRGDDDLNLTYFKNKTALRPHPVKEDALSRFSSELSDQKIRHKTKSQENDVRSPEANAGTALVKITGQSNVKDWDACARKTGGVFDETRAGFDLLPEFSNCMRSAGYVTEAEALEVFDQNRPQLKSAITKQASAEIDDAEWPIATRPMLRQ